MSPQYLLSLILFVFSSVLVLPGISFGQNSLLPGAHVPDELLVAPHNEVSDAELEGIYKGHGGKLIKKITKIRTHVIKVPAQALDAVESALSKNPKVKYVEKNFLHEVNFVPSDPGYSSQWHLPRISAPSGWDISVGSSSTPIAGLDTGVDPTHPDLAAKLLPGYNFVSNNTDIHDTHGHGTATAGVAAAIGNNGIGVAGVAWNNPIMPIVVASSTGSVSSSASASGIIYAADHGAKVINMSYGGGGGSSTEQNAINYAWSKGLVLVAAAGNNSSSSPFYPAAFNNVVAVSATDKSDNRTSFTNFGSWVDVAAPGYYIYTTKRGGGYSNWIGTSFSSPQVAGLAALILSLNPALSNAQVVDLIKSNADDLGSAGFDQYFGWGRINVFQAVSAADMVPALSVAIVNPTDGNTVSGTVPVSTTASSDAGIMKVELYVDGVLKDTETNAPYNLTWNASGLSGSHTLVARAHDVAGNTADSQPVDLNVAASETTPPSVQITSVAFSGKFMAVTVSASDPNAGQVVKVELYVDGALKATDTSNPWSFKINVRSWAKGSSHVLKAKAYDAVGNVGTSTQVNVAK